MNRCAIVLSMFISVPLFAGDAKEAYTRARAILEARCFSCHGPEKQKADLRLDLRSSQLRGGESGKAAIVPGKSAESPLIRYVTGKEETWMPPKGERLSAADVALLQAWIDAGAHWPDDASGKTANGKEWWSLQPIVKVTAPPVSPDAVAWQRTPIDAFILAKLQEKKLQPSKIADRRTLIRRVYFDLTGLPSTFEESEAFAVDASPDAYEKLVDRLLASPNYGERWARHWLDVAHFGETHGYDKDQPRPNAWPYRDYVIRAFNEDKPYARFIQEQLAGDVLFAGTRDGIEALGFIAAGPWDLIGHAEVPESKIDGKIARHLDRDDMVASTIGTFNSMTVHCAQCHNHKFDPIQQEDYYALQAVFAAVDRADKRFDIDPAVAIVRAKLESEKRSLDAQRKDLDAKLAKAGGAELAELGKKIATAEKAASQGLRPEYGWHSAISLKQDTAKWVQLDLGRSSAIEHVVLAPCQDDFNGIGAGFGFPLRFRIEVSDDAEFRGTPTVLAAHDLVDYARPGTAPQSFVCDGKSGRYVRVTATLLAPRKDDYIFALAELQVFDAAGNNLAKQAAVSAIDSIEAPVRWAKKNLIDGIYPAATGGGEDLAALRNKRDEIERKALSPESQELRVSVEKRLRDTQEQLGKLPASNVVYCATVYTGGGNFSGTGASGGKPRPIHVLARGDVQRPGKTVSPGTLSCVPGLPARFDLPADAQEGERRAALAKWVSDSSNPLTWRSIVNRVWLYHFGMGLVETPNDFGRMGQTPSHPELLDWLAHSFRDDMGGSLKKLHKLIVISAVYCQSSESRTDAAGLDPDNRYLWRMNRRKLEAEAVRDGILVVAGKLNPQRGGPSFQDFVVQRPEHSPHYKYALADPENAAFHRRSIYRFIVRSQQNPFMATLDCADPSMAVEKRNQTITPLQALTQLNNQLVLSMSGHFAKRVQSQAGSDPRAQAVHAVRDAFSREARAEELVLIEAYIRKHGLSNACRLLLNLNEFVFVD